jgi:hypothetical protein
MRGGVGRLVFAHVRTLALAGPGFLNPQNDGLPHGREVFGVRHGLAALRVAELRGDGKRIARLVSSTFRRRLMDAALRESGAQRPWGGGSSC